MLDKIAQEIFIEICAYLTLSDVHSLSCCNSFFYGRCREEKIWINLMKHIFPVDYKVFLRRGEVSKQSLEQCAKCRIAWMKGRFDYKCWLVDTNITKFWVNHFVFYSPVSLLVSGGKAHLYVQDTRGVVSKRFKIPVDDTSYSCDTNSEFVLCTVKHSLLLWNHECELQLNQLCDLATIGDYMHAFLTDKHVAIAYSDSQGSRYPKPLQNVALYDIHNQQWKTVFEGHTSGIFSFQRAVLDDSLCASTCKSDLKIWDERKGASPVYTIPDISYCSQLVDTYIAGSMRNCIRLMDVRFLKQPVFERPISFTYETQQIELDSMKIMHAPAGPLQCYSYDGTCVTITKDLKVHHIAMKEAQVVAYSSNAFYLYEVY